MIYQLTKRTKPEDIVYSLHIYFSGLSLRDISKAIFNFIKRYHSAIRDCCIQRYKSKRVFYKETEIVEYIIDETQIKVCSECIWLWVATESVTRIHCCYKHIKGKKHVCSTKRFL